MSRQPMMTRTEVRSETTKEEECLVLSERDRPWDTRPNDKGKPGEMMKREMAHFYVSPLCVVSIFSMREGLNNLTTMMNWGILRNDRRNKLSFSMEIVIDVK